MEAIGVEGRNQRGEELGRVLSGHVCREVGVCVERHRGFWPGC